MLIYFVFDVILTDINECDDPNSNFCEGVCTNTPGSYTCHCKDGYIGDGLINGSGCAKKSSQFPIIKFSLGNLLAVHVLIVSS